MDLVADYSTIIDNKPLKFINRMLIYKNRKNYELRNWQMYLMNYHKMDNENYSEYKNILETNISTRSTDDILKEAGEIQAKINAGKEAK